VNVLPGTYSTPGGYTPNVHITHGGNLASPSGYVVYRCTTLNGCVLTNSWAGFEFDQTQPMPSYVVIDGFEMFASSKVTYGQGVKVYTGDSNATTSHHVWVLNNVVHGYGQSGVSMSEGEYHYVIHNTLYDNSQATCDAQGSGISYWVELPITGYTPTADDSRYAPFHNVIAWNVTYNNGLSNSFCPGSYHTDGNGIIMDTFGTYPNQTLVAFNVSYNNGGGGVHIFNSSHVTVANNSAYNNWLDPDNTGTWRANIDVFSSGSDNLVINNIGFAVLGGAPPFNAATAFLAAGSNSGTFGNNVASGDVSMNDGNTFSCSANHCNTNPSWVDVGSTSRGTQTTPPVGVNFALGAASPAIGFGQTPSYLPAQAVDVGACHHSLATCP